MLQHNYKLSLQNNGLLEVNFNERIDVNGSNLIHIHIIKRGYNHSENNGTHYDREKIYPIVADEKISIPENVLPALITILQKIKF